MFYTLSLISFMICIVLVTYYKRAAILPMLPSSLRGRLSPYMNHYASIPTSFAAQAANGFSSSNFDLEANIAGDSRAGLDDSVLAEIRDIMHREHVNFDEARLIRHKLNMARNGVDPRTGLPTDTKAITRL